MCADALGVESALGAGSVNAAGTEQRGDGMPAEPSGERERTTLLRVANVAKAFGPTQAVRDASFELRAGEVHALVGENGCGKSTVVKILSGVHMPDAGEIELEGRLVPSIKTPRDAQRRGIFTSFQEVLVAESRSVLDNVWLGADDTWRARVTKRDKVARARQMLGELLGREVDLSMAVEELSLSDRQACGIVRALVREPKILILDEATSALDVATRDRLFAIVGDLSRRGAGVIFITHRMDEIEQIGDRITVMRSGRSVAELDRGQWTPQQLVRLMTGADALVGRERGPAATDLGPARCHGAQRPRAPAPRRTHGRSTSRSRQASSSAWPASRAMAATPSSRRCAAGSRRKARLSATPTAARWSSARRPTRPITTSRTCLASVVWIRCSAG